MIKLDVKDKKILRVLTIDGTMPVASIAKTAGISREVAIYRITRLEKEGVILHRNIAIDYNQIGYHNFLVLLKVTNISTKLKDYILKEDIIVSLSTSINDDLLFMDVASNDINNIYEIINDIKYKFNKEILNISINYIIRDYPVGFSFLKTKGKDTDYLDKKPGKVYILDDIDKKIINDLS